jgi:hypothetical protein
VIYDNNLTNKDDKRLIKKMIKMIQSLKNISTKVSNIKNKKFINVNNYTFYLNNIIFTKIFVSKNLSLSII